MQTTSFGNDNEVEIVNKDRNDQSQKITKCAHFDDNRQFPIPSSPFRIVSASSPILEQAPSVPPVGQAELDDVDT
ncbi:hypothetical protein BLNAU_14962 [Blattamonas nauphoetae]|nr:hypothetical protein BLNAU_18655 [Blattamonas nauphoetae]KAK2950160.1 hypothetical protein BLNAU_14962 [Blattamonas nauphoetae]